MKRLKEWLRAFGEVAYWAYLGLFATAIISYPLRMWLLPKWFPNLTQFADVVILLWLWFVSSAGIAKYLEWREGRKANHEDAKDR